MSTAPIIAKLRPDRADEGLRIAYHPLKFGDYKLELQLTADALEMALKANSGFEVPTEPIILARYKKATRTLTTYPVSTTFGAYFLEPKYLHLKTIILEGVESPTAAMEDRDYLYYEELPSGIIREPLACDSAWGSNCRKFRQEAFVAD